MEQLTTSKILGVLNHAPSVIENLLESKGITFQLVLDSKQLQRFRPKTVYGFTSSETLFKSIQQLKRPPILWDSPSVFNHISLSQPISLLDAKIMRDGIIIFEALKKDKLRAFMKKKFEALETPPMFSKVVTKQLGNDSKFSELLNKLLVTLPDYVYEPTIIAVTTACEQGNYKILSEYLNNNRLITDVNKEQYKEFSSYLKGIKQYITYMISKTEKKVLSKLDKETKSSLKRVRFFINYFGTKRLEDYLDCESSVNNC
jgi:hypothetical protein